jgi:two-component system LytT family response regulator
MTETRIRTVIVDDEAPARSLVREYLGAHRDIEIVGECANGFEAVKRIGELLPDLVLLDIQMPKLDGFEVLELLDPQPAVVFVTAYDEHALRAFDVHAVDYVLKPVARERLDDALGRVRMRLAGRAAAGVGPSTGSAINKPASSEPSSSGTTDSGVAAAPAPLSPTARAAAARPPGQYLERILIKDGANVHVIPVERIDRIEAQDDYAAFHTEGKSFLKPQTLGELEAALDPARFIRVHRSHLLNVDRLGKLELYAKDSRVAVLKDGTEIPVSRGGYAKLKELLEGR